MDLPRQIVSLISPVVPLAPVIRLTGQKIIFPLYHAVSEEQPAHLEYLYRVRNRREFEKDLETLCRYYEPLSPEILRAPGKMKKLRKPGFLLSFDDGLREITGMVEPILTRKGINAIFFLNNAFIDNRAMFFRYKASVLCGIISRAPSMTLPELEIARLLGLGHFDKKEVMKAILHTGYLHKSRLDALADLTGFDITAYLAEKKPYMTDSEIRSLMGKGFHIGAHTYDHPLLTDLNEEQMKFEIMASIEDLVQRFNPPMRFFAFPFTDQGVSSRVIDSAFENEFQALFGCAGLKKEKQTLHFQRIPFEKSTDSVYRQLQTEYLFYFLKILPGLNTAHR